MQCANTPSNSRLCVLRSPNQRTVALFLRDSSEVRWNINEHLEQKSEKVHLEITILS